jgi:hypothetical protein
LSEFLVTAVFAGASIQDYLKIVQEAQHFVTKPFGVRAAVEVAERLAAAIKAGDKREGQKSEPWEKLNVRLPPKRRESICHYLCIPYAAIDLACHTSGFFASHSGVTT